jgi:hypothetical protein
MQLTKSCNELNSTNNVGSKVLVHGDIGSAEDCDCVENNNVDSGPLLKEHCKQAQDKRMPHLFGLQLSEEGERDPASKMF